MDKLALFDLITMMVIGTASFKGFMNGFMKEFFGVMGMGGGLLAAFHIGDDVGKFVDQNITDISAGPTMFIVGFMTAFMVIWFAASLVGVFFTKLTDISGLGVLNRVFGFAVAGAKVFVVFSIITYMAAKLPIVTPMVKRLTNNSMTYVYFHKTGSSILDYEWQNFKKQLMAR